MSNKEIKSTLSNSKVCSGTNAIVEHNSRPATSSLRSESKISRSVSSSKPITSSLSSLSSSSLSSSSLSSSSLSSSKPITSSLSSSSSTSKSTSRSNLCTNKTKVPSQHSTTTSIPDSNAMPVPNSKCKTSDPAPRPNIMVGSESNIIAKKRKSKPDTITKESKQKSNNLKSEVNSSTKSRSKDETNKLSSKSKIDKSKIKSKIKFKEWIKSLPPSTIEERLHLQIENSHPRDDYVLFDEKPHQYYIYDKETNKPVDGLISITQFIHSFFKPFDTEKQAQATADGKGKDESSEYYGKTKEQIIKQWDMERELGTRMHKMIELFYNNIDPEDCDELFDQFDDKDTKDIKQDYNKDTKDIKSEKQDYNKDTKDIKSEKQDLKDTKDIKQDYKDDRTIEKRIRNSKLLNECIEYQYFQRFNEDIVYKNKWIPYRTEWRIWCSKLKIVGTIDMIFVPNKNKPKEIIIYDWKRSKGIKISTGFKCKNEILDHLDDCNFVHYSLQLNLYKYLLENNYGYDVIGMFLGVFHPNDSTYQYLPVPDRSEQIQSMLEVRIKAINDGVTSKSKH